MDVIQRNGNYPVPPQAPKTLGVEFSGTIESFGDGPEKGFKEGDEVYVFECSSETVLFNEESVSAWLMVALMLSISLCPRTCSSISRRN